MAPRDEILRAILDQVGDVDRALRREVLPYLTQSRDYGERLARLEEFRRAVEAVATSDANANAEHRRERSRLRWALVNVAISVVTSAATFLAVGALKRALGWQ